MSLIEKPRRPQNPIAKAFGEVPKLKPTLQTPKPCTPTPPPTANKHDSGKQRWDLIFTFLPPDALHEVARVMDHGADVYGFENWHAGMNWSRYFNAAIRHLWAWWRAKVTLRPETDPDSGLHHLAHATCDVLFMLAYVLRDIPTDDRREASSRVNPTHDPKDDEIGD